jgi:hypothetical protein
VSVLSNDRTDKLEIIKNLLLDEEAIGEAAVYQVTVLQSMIEYESTSQATQEDLKNTVISKLKEKRPFSPSQRAGLNEGLLQFSSLDNKVDFYYIKEVAFRWEYVSPQDSSIQSLNIKRVDSAYRVRINILFEANKITMTFFGGTDSLVFRAREVVGDAIKQLVNNFKKTDVSFSAKQMQNMLSVFGKHVALINIDPRDNEKFSKSIERQKIGKPEIERVTLYDVFNFRMTGVQIVNSPEVSRLIKEEGIRLMEFSGGLFLEMGIRVTCRVKENGRVEFMIPSKHFGTDSKTIYDTAVKLYSMLIGDNILPEKGPLEKYFQESLD